jgi:hypothetical protein
MQNVEDAIRPRPQLGWLAAVVPVAARRFRVTDREFAAAISGSGGEIVESSPDVEIGEADELAGDARVAIVSIEAQAPAVGRPRLVRAAKRVADAARARMRAAAARRAALRRGYTTATQVAWERHTILLPGLAGAPRGAPLYQRFPRQFVVVCKRGPGEQTTLESSLAAASRELGRDLDIREVVLGASGVLIAPSEDFVLRVSLGPAAERIEEQRAALVLLRDGNPEAAVAERVPWVAASGSAGLARWSVERALRGTRDVNLGAAIAGESLDFLAKLFVIQVDGGASASPVRDAEICAGHFPERAETLRDLGQRLEDDLSSVPRGFAHGDFWAGNLLVEDGRLLGVVDWPSAGPGRFPLLDVLHMRSTEIRERTGARLATVVTEHLLPQAAAGGDDLDLEYCRRLELDLGASDLESLVGAYWLEELRRALVDPDRDPAEPRRSEWRNANIEALSALARTRGLRVGSH